MTTRQIARELAQIIINGSAFDIDYLEQLLMTFATSLKRNPEL
jgi:hypothetical protein